MLAAVARARAVRHNVRIRLPPLALLLAAGCCGMPPRVDDPTTPQGAYETFRGALARGEYQREFARVGDPLLRRLGIRGRADWIDMRAVVLDDGHILVRGIRCSDVASVRFVSPDLAELRIDFPLGREGTVVMRRHAVVRGYLAEQDHPELFELLPSVTVEATSNGLLLRMPEGLMEAIAPYLAETEFVRIEYRYEWFLEDFAAEGETPDTVREVREAAGAQEQETP